MARRDYTIGACLERSCGHCGQSLDGRRSDAIYCTRRCKDAARRKRLEHPAPAMLAVDGPSLSSIEAAILLDAAAGMTVLNVPTGRGRGNDYKNAARQLRRTRKRLEARGLIRLVGRSQRHPISRIIEQGWLLVTRRYKVLKGSADTLHGAERWWGAEQPPGNAAWPIIVWTGHVNALPLMPSADL